MCVRVCAEIVVHAALPQCFAVSNVFRPQIIQSSKCSNSEKRSKKYRLHADHREREQFRLHMETHTRIKALIIKNEDMHVPYL